MTPAVVWTASIGATTKSLAAWGITSPVLALRSFDVDEFSFVAAGDVRAACPFEFGQPLALFRDGACVFRGTLDDPAAISDPGARNLLGRSRLQDKWRVVAKNVWWQLSRLTYQQLTAAYSQDCFPLGSLLTTKVGLFTDEMTGAAITTGAQIRAALNFAIAHGAVAMAGGIPEFVYLPGETARDLTVADVIRRCAQPTPDAVSWFDYSGGVPVLNVGQRATLNAIEFDHGDDARQIGRLALRKRSDLVPSGVRFNYLGAGSCAPMVKPGCEDPATGLVNSGTEPVQSASPIETTKITQDSAGLPDEVGGLVATIELAQIDAAESEPIPVGLAGQYYLSLLTPPWEGQILLRGRDCLAGVRPGLVVNVANGNPDWAAMRALVQAVELRIAAGETTVTVGPPKHLGPQDFVALLQFTRRRPFIQDAFLQVRAPGTPEHPNCDAGKHPEAKKLLDKLKGNQAATAAAIGGAALANEVGQAIARGEGGGSMVDAELCDNTPISAFRRDTAP